MQASIMPCVGKRRLEEGTVYVSISYATAVHLCCCGCGSEVVTPLAPTDWRITFDGETISLSPSIGNWNFPCKSHYWITRNEVVPAECWTRKEINANRHKDRAEKKKHRSRKDERARKNKNNFWAKAKTLCSLEKGLGTAPAWHEQVLRQTEGRVARLLEAPADWNEAKNQLRSRFA